MNILLVKQTFIQTVIKSTKKSNEMLRLIINLALRPESTTIRALGAFLIAIAKT